MEWAVGEREEPLRPDDETSFPYCAAQCNLDKKDTRTGRSVPSPGGNAAGDRDPGGAGERGASAAVPSRRMPGLELGVVSVYSLTTRGARMRARIKWTEGMSFVGETGSGHALVIDGAPEHGGRDLGPRPMELVLAGAAACTAFDVVLILKKARQPVADCVVEAEADRAAVEPKVFTRIRLAYTIAGRGLDPRQVERAVKLSKEKYCSATIMLARTAEIETTITIVEGDRIPLPGAFTDGQASG